MGSDQNFDQLVAKFKKNIYQSNKGEIRQAVLHRDLSPYLSSKLRILDAGGGFGTISQRLAADGHDITICDISSKMLDEARLIEQSASYPFNLKLINLPLQNLTVDEHGSFDLILCHAVVEWLEKGYQDLKNLITLLKPKGILSLMFYNKDGQTFHNLSSGNLDYVANNLKTKKTVRLTPKHAFTFDEITMWTKSMQLTTLHTSGVRVISDYLKKPDLVDKNKLIAMELEYSTKHPYFYFGRYIHLILQKNS